jgi:hypothetical protein
MRNAFRGRDGRVEREVAMSGQELIHSIETSKYFDEKSDLCRRICFGVFLRLRILLL